MKRQSLASWCLVALFLAGCGGQGDISGTVTYKGAPLSGGTVVFFDSRNGTANSPIGPDGSYNITSVPTGEARIAVFPPTDIRFGFGEHDPPPKKTDAKRIDLPTKYNDPGTSGLTYRVRRGPQEHAIALD
jgi:hypothetical protein